VSHGWVYFAQDGDRTKIGWTQGAVQKRLRSLRTAAPTIELVHVIRTDDKALEKELHKLFIDYRISGEWFALPDDWRAMLPEQNRRRGSRIAEVTTGVWDQKSLIGSWFHSFTDEGKFRWQGCVVADLGAGYVLVQTYDWIMGRRDDQYVVPILSTTSWHFYDSNEEMREAYELSPQRSQAEDRSYGERVIDVADIVEAS
jgi:hypothetical protein